MTTFYAVATDGTRLDCNSVILSAPTDQAAIAALKAAVAAMGEELEFLGVESGNWGDAAIKVHGEPSEHDLMRWAAEIGVPADSLIVQAPGSHPGGNFYWITPAVDVLVAVYGPRQ